MRFSQKSITVINVVYQLACLSGLIYQVAELSINYFQFPTVSSIEFQMPGRERRKAINICFRNDEFLNYEKYQEILASKTLPDGMNPDDALMRRYLVQYEFTIRERFKMSISTYTVHGPMQVTPFIVGRYYCYQTISDNSTGDVINAIYDMSKDGSKRQEPYATFAIFNVSGVLSNVTEFRIAMTPNDKLPYFEFSTVDPIYYNYTESHETFVSSHFYYFHKLTAPYIDDCFDYTQLGFQDKDDIISTCADEKYLKKFNKTTRQKIFTPLTMVDHANLITIIETYFRQCHKKYRRDDCERENTFTTIYHDEDRMGTGDINLRNIASTKPSYICKNSPKIEHVDYVTYCFGAAGTWFGFCFLMLNPVNFIPKSSLATDDQDHVIQGEDAKPTRMTRRSLDIESRYNKFKIIDSQLNILFTKIKKLEKEKQKNVDRRKISSARS